MEEFYILSLPRTASTYLCYRLDSHPDIRCYLELFHFRLRQRAAIIDPAPAPNPARRRDLRFLRPLLPALEQIYTRALLLHKLLIQRIYTHPRRYIAAFLKTQNPSKRFVGFKIIYYQQNQFFIMKHIYRYWIRRLIAQSDAKFLLLTRDNVLEQFISFKTAALSRVWHHIDGDPTQRPAGLKFHFDKAEFERFHARCQRLHHELQTQLQRHHRPYLEISYETLTRTPDPEARILAFLGAAPAPLATSKTRKINTAPMETYVENWPDVVAALSGTPYEHYLGQ